MGTRAFIVDGSKEAEGFNTISLNYDGYYSHAGKILEEHFSSQDKVDALIALGDLSVLEPSIECPDGHSWSTPVPKHTIAYGRDRGEDKTKAVKYFTQNGVLGSAKKHGIEWVYVWNGSEWKIWGSK